MECHELMNFPIHNFYLQNVTLYVTWDEKKILVGKKIEIEVLTDF